MIYRIIVDKQPKTNPSSEKKEYIIETDELRRKGDVYDSINITTEKTYVTRKLSLSEYGILTELEKPIQEEFGDLNIQLFEGNNYIYLMDLQGNNFYAEYLIKNDFTDIYVTNNQMNSAINQSAKSIEISVNQKLEGYSTTEEMNAAIKLNSDQIMSEVNKKVGEDEFGTKIEQNWEHVKIAWNQISQSIQFEGDNGDATMAFYDNNTKFAEMGVNTIENDRYISFAIPCDYGKDIADGMAWGIQTTSDNKFWPILYVKDFHMANKNAGDFSGQLVLTACTLNLEGINSAITCGNINITNAGAFGGLLFEDTTTHQSLLTIMPSDSPDSNAITILDKIKFFKNQSGSNSLRLGLNEKYAMLTDEGKISGEELFINGDATVLGQFINPSVERIKKNIQKLENGLDIVLNTEIYTYNLKREKDEDKKHIGFVIGKNYKYSKEITSKKNNGVDLYSMISVAYKAIQELVQKIEKLEVI